MSEDGIARYHYVVCEDSACTAKLWGTKYEISVDIYPKPGTAQILELIATKHLDRDLKAAGASWLTRKIARRHFDRWRKVWGD